MPRLSIDIDLVYLPIEPRGQTLNNIENSLNAVAKDIEHKIVGVKVAKLTPDKHVIKLLVEHNGTNKN